MKRADRSAGLEPDVIDVPARRREGLRLEGIRRRRADAGDVFFDVGLGLASVHNANGSDWYYNGESSWGFAPPGAGVNRDACDIAATRPEQRLCWHTDGANVQPGWRCGATTGLNGDGRWERLIFQRHGGF